MESEKKEFRYIVSVKFKTANKVYSFGTNDETLQYDDAIIVETQRGLEYGKLVSGLRDPIEHDVNVPLKPIIRKANGLDFEKHHKNIIDAEEAKEICAKEIAKLNLDMHLISAEYTFDRAKLSFVYSADDRVDFRELLKILAQKFHTRIELRQIGARDKAKIVGGIGVCGRELCCSAYKTNFDVISINLAKTQLLALNISKLSGQCGKLKCCLKYENEVYKEIRKGLPKINAHVDYEGEHYRLSSMNVLNDSCKLENKKASIYPKITEVLEKGIFKNELENKEEKIAELKKLASTKKRKEEVVEIISSDFANSINLEKITGKSNTNSRSLKNKAERDKRKNTQNKSSSDRVNAKSIKKKSFKSKNKLEKENQEQTKVVGVKRVFKKKTNKEG